MDPLTEKDYSELIEFLISGLRNCHAYDIVRQIEELETVNIIEETPPTGAYAARKLPDLDGFWVDKFEKEPYSFRPVKKVDKKLEREAVSEYSSRPMTSQEIYYASLDILEAYLLSVPQILEGMQKNLQLSNLSNIIWKNEGERHAESAPVNIIEAVGGQMPEARQKMGEIIKTLKNVPGKEYT